MKRQPLTSAKRFQEKYPAVWEAAQAAIAQAVEELAFVESHRTTFTTGEVLSARWMPTRVLAHDDEYEWVSVEAHLDTDDNVTSVQADVVAGDRWYDWSRDCPAGH